MSLVWCQSSLAGGWSAASPLWSSLCPRYGATSAANYWSLSSQQPSPCYAGLAYRHQLAQHRCAHRFGWRFCCYWLASRWHQSCCSGSCSRWLDFLSCFDFSNGRSLKSRQWLDCATCLCFLCVPSLVLSGYGYRSWFLPQQEPGFCSEGSESRWSLALEVAGMQFAVQRMAAKREQAAAQG